ncbi:MAG TPA: hypothetical protein VF720_12155 [Candidatus Eisenbacteria bacterium]
MTGRQLALAVTSFLLALLAPEARGTRILVPESMSLSAAVNAAAPGDTLSLATGTYERIPDPFVKSIVIEARQPEDPPVLRRLEAGLVTLRHLDFVPEGPGEVNPILFRALDSVRLEGCRFSGFASTGIDARDAPGDHAWLVSVEACRFNLLNRGIDAAFVNPGSRIDVHDSAFESSFYGIRMATTARQCPGGAGSEPPSLTGMAALNLLDCRFTTLNGSAVEAHEGTWAVSMSNCRIEGTKLGVELIRAGASLERTEIIGNGFDSIGIQANSSRIEVASSILQQHALAIGLTAASGCERPAGIIGGQIEHFCRLNGNVVALATSHPVNADANWWGTLICSEAHERIQGMTIQTLVDDAGSFEVECMTVVTPTTWGRLKARIAP